MPYLTHPIGLCKECYSPLTFSNQTPEYFSVFECTNCGYPNNIADMWFETEEQYTEAMELDKYIELSKESQIE